MNGFCVLTYQQNRIEIMWKKINDLKYLTIAQYYIPGIVLAVLVYVFIANSLQHQNLDFYALISTEALTYCISAVIGALFGGLVYVFMENYKINRQFIELVLWKRISAKRQFFFFQNVVAFAIAGFVGSLLMNLMNIESFDNLVQTLFSIEAMTGYVAAIVAMSIFSVSLSLGIIKRLELLYKK